jgi:threonine/homoserine/homoserine lactone efflux protein
MFILIGVIIGFVVCIPPGPVNIVIISQAMKRGFLHGFVAGVTASTLDALYCLLAVLGVSRLVSYLDRFQSILKVLAFVVLALLAYRVFRQSREYQGAKPDKKATAVSARPLAGIFLLYVTNPSLYAFWLGTATFVTGHGWVSNDRLTAVLFAGACWVGCVTWYFILNHYVAKYHHLFKPRTYQRIFLVLGIILCIFAVLAVLSIFVRIPL